MDRFGLVLLVVLVAGCVPPTIEATPTETAQAAPSATRVPTIVPTAQATATPVQTATLTTTATETPGPTPCPAGTTIIRGNGDQYQSLADCTWKWKGNATEQAGVWPTVGPTITCGPIKTDCP